MKKSRRLFDAIFLPLTLVSIMWILELSKSISGGQSFSYNEFGLMPRSLEGLIGIFTAPMLHGSWSHLFSNSGPMLVLSGLTLYFYRRVATFALISIWLGSGILVWLFSFQDNVSHIGASGVVFGLAAFVAGSGIFRKGNLRATALALLVVVSYGGMFWSLFRLEEGISWEYHFFGTVMGFVTAWVFRGIAENYEDPLPFSVPQPTHEPDYFLPRDIFDKTKQARREEAEAERLFNEMLRQQPPAPQQPMTPWEWYLSQKAREQSQQDQP